MNLISYVGAIITSAIFLLSAQNIDLNTSIKSLMDKKSGACVFVNCTNNEVVISDSVVANDRLPPCSSFKIWNTLIGAECKLIDSASQAFYKWDGQTRSIPMWNKDLTLRESFQVSCVPAYQNLARKIGNENMKIWIEAIGYGDKDISSGIDCFWLPDLNRKTILISAKEQAILIKRLVNKELPFSDKSQQLLKDVMMVNKTDKGIWFGKTGSGSGINNNLKLSVGWFVGYIVSSSRVYSFACVLKGENVAGKDAKVIIESILVQNNLM